MKTEYILSTADVAKVNWIDNEIMRLQAERAAIFALAPIRCVTENAEEADIIERSLLYEENSPLNALRGRLINFEKARESMYGEINKKI